MSAKQQKVFAPDISIKITKWKVREGYRVSAGQLVLLYVDADGDGKETKRLKCGLVGVVQKRLFREGDIVPKGEAILELGECSHTTVIKDMCAECGADLRQDENGKQTEASIPMVHSVPELKVSHQLAQKLGQADTERLLGDKKLVLLVDLDQTLIHTTNDRVPNNLKDVYHFQLYPNSPWYHTRLRPGTAQFLTNMAPYFELHICTFGARNYAHQIAQFLDESGKFFSHRILSRDECLNITSKTDNLKALFPCGDSMVCIIDDREDVWNMASNLIQVKPYHFFQHTGDINAPPGMSKHELDGKGVDFSDMKDAKRMGNSSSTSSKKDSTKKTNQTEATAVDLPNDKDKTGEKDGETSKEKIPPEEELDKPATESEKSSEKDEEDGAKTPSSNSADSDSDQLIELEDPDDYLLYLEQILVKIHSRFYDIYERSKEIPDLKVLVPKIRSEILVGRHLVFSGLVPNHVKLEQSKAYLIARGMGATVTQDFNSHTTHLVAANAGTIKAIAARKKVNVKIVTPDWLWCCAERWEHVDERLYPLDPNKPSKMRQPPPHTLHSPEHGGGDKGTGSDDESNAGSSSKMPFHDNPLLSFTHTELAEMNKDFDEFFKSSDSSSSSSGDGEEEPVDIENPPVRKALRKRKRREEREEKLEAEGKAGTSSVRLNFAATEDSVDNRLDGGQESSSEEDDSPTAKFRRGGDLPSDLDLGSNSGGSDEDKCDDDGEWNMMGAALEREFLGMD